MKFAIEKEFTGYSVGVTTEIRAAVSASDVVAQYPDIFGVLKSGFCTCPVHGGDHTPSLRVYEGERGWYCFGCQEGGDVIKLVQKAVGLNYRQAVYRIDTDFGLNLFHRAPTPGEQVKKSAIQQKRTEYQMEKAEQRKMLKDGLWILL